MSDQYPEESRDLATPITLGILSGVTAVMSSLDRANFSIWAFGAVSFFTLLVLSMVFSSREEKEDEYES